MVNITLADEEYQIDISFDYLFNGTGLQNCGDLAGEYTLHTVDGLVYDSRNFTSAEISAANEVAQTQVMKIDESTNCWFVVMKYGQAGQTDSWNS
jgi:hypothetical protein